MSEFVCQRGHDMRSIDFRCHICGSRVARMDGKSERQLRAEDEEWDKIVEEVEEEE
jgi:hypothetical protein